MYPAFSLRHAVRPKPVGYDQSRSAVTLHGALQELQRGPAIPALRRKDFQHLAFVIHGAPKIVCLLRSTTNGGGAHDTIRISGRENCHWLAIRHSRHRSHREAEATGVQSRLDSDRRPACNTWRRENLDSRICRPAGGESITTAPRSDRVAWVGVIWLAIEMTGFGCTLPSEPPPHHVRSSPNSGPPSANV